MEQDDRNKKIFTILTWITVIVFSGLYITLIFSTNIWTDEAFTLQLLQNDIRGIINGTAQDVHPPLYYLYAKVFYSVFNGSLIWQKIATILPMTLTLILGSTIIRKEFGSVTSFLFNIFICCIPCSMEFTVQVRMYSLAFLFVTFCGVKAYQAIVHGRKMDFFWSALSGVCAAYTHYFAFVSIICIVVFLLIAILVWKREYIIHWIVMSICMIVSYLPWMPYFFQQVINVERGYWIPPISAEVVWGFFVWTFDLEKIFGSVFAFLIILKTLSMVNICRLTHELNRERIYAIFCMLVPTFTCLVGVILSCLKTPIYREQYIFPSLGMLALFFAIVLSESRTIWIIICSAFLLFVGTIQYKESYEQEYTSTLWPETQAFLEENFGENDYILHNYRVFEFIYKFYFPADRLFHFEDFDYFQDFDTLWYIDTEWNSDLNEAYLECYNLQMEYIGHYGIEHNEFDLYKVTRR